MSRILALPLCFVLLFSASSAHAVVGPPRLVPTTPIAGQTISVAVPAGYCDAYVWNEPDYPKVSQVGNAIRIILDSVHADDPILCVYGPPGNAAATFPVGAFPSGSYTLQVDRHYDEFLGPSDIIETVGMLAFVVAAPASVPATDKFFALAAIALLAILAVRALARSRRRIFAMLLVVALPSVGHAETSPDQLIEVLLATGPDMPTAEDVVAYFWFLPPDSPPLQAFKKAYPNGADFLLPWQAEGNLRAWLGANPESVRAKLERYLLIRYSAETDIQFALATLQADPAVAVARLPQTIDFTVRARSGEAIPAPNRSFPPSTATSYSQYGWSDLNIAAAWQHAGGYALIGDVDSGLATDHSLLRQFSDSGQYLGGNFVPASSADVGAWPDGFDFNVDEQEPIHVVFNSNCNPGNLSAVPPTFAGHGTHVAGLISANPDASPEVKGICKHCGIAMFKVTRHKCAFENGDWIINSDFNSSAFAAAVTMMADTGVQVMNMSLGNPQKGAGYCEANPNDALCLALAHSVSRDVVGVAASGNARTQLQFPANDGRPIAAGGFSENLTLWDESPGGMALCPYSPFPAECGSNYTTVFNGPRQESMASAQAVLSTTYPGKNWNSTIHCGDSFGPGNGVGFCTGTSMSAPQISGVMGILRSINPLVPGGQPVLNFGGVVGVRGVLAQTSAEAQMGTAWTQTFGFGRPDAAAAAARVLGKVEGHTVHNRATPLFRFYGAAAKDYLETTSPQMAVAFAINQASQYTPQGALVPGYTAFPHEPGTTPLPAPRANVYVLTTEYTPRPEWPALVPLHLVERTRHFPVGCAFGSPGCNSANRDFTLVSTVADIEATHADGYSLRTIQGYIYQPCAAEPACIPPGAQKLYRECKPADDDCAVFLESERAAFEAAGYTSAYPAGSSKRLGYAYPVTDSDGDGLVDGLEYAIGTKVDVADSDGDGAPDGVEFPLSGIAISDPCSGAAGGSCPADVIFRHGFQIAG